HSIVAALALAAFVVAAVGFALWVKRSDTGRQTPLASMKITRLANTEKSEQVAISPDGKYIAHVISSAGQRSLWVVQVATNSSMQKIPPAAVAYGGLTFSKDGDYIFYVNNGELYQIPVLGGEARRILAGVSGAISFAPDGGRFAFVRSLDTGETALMIANVNGDEERTLATRKKPEFLSSAGPSWSPDGNLIACSWGMTAGQREMGIVGVEVATGREKQITDQKWQVVERVAWLSDGSGLIAPAEETVAGPLQIWHIPYPVGEARRITSDLNNYGDLSLTADANNLVTIQFEQRSSLWIVPNGEPSQAKPLASGKHDLYRAISLTHDGRILYPSNAGGNRDIWIMNADGTNQKQLTANAGQNLQPSASRDGRYIVFLSNRAKTGAFNIWRIDMDGGNPTQLTHGSGEVQPSCSPDGRWVVYSQGGPETGPEKKTVWKVPIDGGEPVRLTNTPANGPAISPDGKLIACWYKQDAASPWKIALIPIEGGPPVKTFNVTRTSNFRLRWTPDGQAISYINTRDGVSNIWSQPISGGGPPKQLTQFTSEQIEAFDWSAEGQLICSRGHNARDIVLITGFR
ncbi:MAG: DPP IV N-terminal domain-containing protein, partial [Acidobacteriota bacterium]|nr:DPP IV N-terminal domain-containing protein [Acidobacteriota bacterium]